MSKPFIIKVPDNNASIVALNDDKKVVASGNEMKTVIEKAKKSGVKDPSIMFVPKQGRQYIY